MKRLLALTFLALFILILLPVGLLLAAPEALLKPLANYYLDHYHKELHAELVSLKGVKISRATLVIESLELHSPDYRTRGTGLRLGYQLLGLNDVSLGHIELGQLEIETVSTQPPQGDVEPQLEEGDATPLATILESLQALPFEELLVRSFAASLGAQEISGELLLDGENAELDILLRSSSYAEYELGLTGRFADSRSLQWQAALASGDDDLLAAGIDLSWDSGRFVFSGESQLLLSRLRSIPPVNEALRELEVFNESLELLMKGSFSDPFQSVPSAAPAEYSLSLTGPAASLNASQRTAYSERLAQINLPLTVSGTLDLRDARLRVDFDSAYATVSDVGADHEFYLELNLASSSASCSLPFITSLADSSRTGNEEIHCQGEAGFSAGIPAASMANLSAQGSTLAGELQVDFSTGNDDAILSISLPALAVNSGSFIAAETSGSLVFEFRDIEIDLIPSLNASADGLLVDSTLDLGEWQLNNPGIQGSLAFEESVLSGQLGMGLKNVELASMEFRHDLATGAGALQVAMPGLAFDNINPLSAYIPQAPFALELVSGQIAGDSAIEWQQFDGELILSGYGDMQMTSLDGSYDELFFVGFDSQLESVLVNSGDTLVSRQPATASLKLLDIGLPLEDSRWSYALDYDRASGNIRVDVQDFSTQVLGGRASVAAANLDSAAASSLSDGQIDLVLSGLNVTSIIGLADYPGVYADGLISGYLPISIADGVFTVTDGLIGALQPGGLIRYTPSSPAPSDNSTMQLLNDALSNYQYKILNNNVVYHPNGDLVMAVELKGANPDMNGGQEINLNINISDNIPTLLESLQAGRVISDALEAAAANR